VSLRLLDGDTVDTFVASLEVLGFLAAELGYVRLSELDAVRGPLGLKIERNYHFIAERTLSAYAADAQVRRRIRA
jgi:hypothetical protein